MENAPPPPHFCNLLLDAVDVREKMLLYQKIDLEMKIQFASMDVRVCLRGSRCDKFFSHSRFKAEQANADWNREICKCQFKRKLLSLKMLLMECVYICGCVSVCLYVCFFCVLTQY